MIRLLDQRTAPLPNRTTQGSIPGSGATRLVLTPRADGQVEVRHAQGISVIPARPQRVAVFGFTDEVLALGVQPCAAGGDFRGFDPLLAPLLEGTRLVDHTGGMPDLETLAEVRPDLIITVWYWLPSYTHFSAIAPTVVMQPGQADWRARFLDVAAVLGRPAEGEARLARLDEKLADARTRLHRVVGEGSVAMLRIFAREYRLYGRGYSGPLLYDDLGFKPAGLVKQLAWDKDAVRLSLEGLLALDADYLFLMHEERVPISGHELAHLTEHPAWQALPAVRAGHVYPVDDLLMRGGIIAREKMLDDLLALMEPPG